jgi:hypothetical protein
VVHSFAVTSRLDTCMLLTWTYSAYYIPTRQARLPPSLTERIQMLTCTPSLAAVAVRKLVVRSALAVLVLIAPGCKDSTEPAGDTCDLIENITIGTPVEGTLGTGDCRLSVDNSFADYWRLVITTQTAVQIDLTSTAFDAYVFLNREDGTNIDQRDSGGEGEDDARLEITLQPGTYIILANSFFANQTGAYQLSVVMDVQ